MFETGHTDERLAAQNTPALAATPMVNYLMRHVCILCTALQCSSSARLNTSTMRAHIQYFSETRHTDEQLAAKNTQAPAATLMVNSGECVTSALCALHCSVVQRLNS